MGPSISWTQAAKEYLATEIIRPRCKTTEDIRQIITTATRIADRDNKPRVDEACVREATGAV